MSVHMEIHPDGQASITLRDNGKIMTIAFASHGIATWAYYDSVTGQKNKGRESVSPEFVQCIESTVLEVDDGNE